MIGKNIYWTPNLQILDRGLLTIGDRVIFGHQVSLTVIKILQQH